MRTSLYVLVGGFLTGVFWRSFFDIGVAGVTAIVCGTLLLGALCYGRMFHLYLYLGLFVCALLMGIVRTGVAHESYMQDRAQVQPGFISTGGLVAAEPDIRDGYTILVLLLLDTDGGETSVRVRAKVSPYPQFVYGELVSFSGTLEVPRAFETDTGRIFDYAGYLMKEGIHYTLKDPTITSTGNRAGNQVQAWLLALKHRWLTSVSRIIPEPGAALAGGLVVGAKQSLGDRWLELFRITGIIHIVVLSGYNLSLIANGIIRVCRVLPTLLGLVFGVFGVIGFSLMAGASATVVRASVMAILAMLAAHVNRPQVVVRLLALAAFVMVCVNPFVLVFDAGFQLSFLATVGLVVYASPLERALSFIPTWGGFRGIVAATFATQLSVLPLLLYQVGSLSLVAPLVNVLVLPAVPFVMALSFVVGVVGGVVPLIGMVVAWPAHILLSYMFSVVAFFGNLSYAAVELPPVPWWLVLLLYVFLGTLTYIRITPHERLHAV